jgi:glycosyltransferase involved in cell wall biosynthesis
MTLSPVIDVIIPAYNEERSIGKVIREIPREFVREIIVCDNNSTDATEFFAIEAGATVVNQPVRGYGNACLSAIAHIFKKPIEMHPEIVVFMDGDYSDFPSEMMSLIEPIMQGHDLVIGSRTTGNYQAGSMTKPQIFGNWLATNLIRILYGVQFTDLGPFRAIRWNKLLELNMKDKNFGWTVEMQVKAVKQNLACIEVPVSYRKRIGQSKISGTLKGSLMAGHKIIWTIFKCI